MQQILERIEKLESKLEEVMTTLKAPVQRNSDSRIPRCWNCGELPSEFSKSWKNGSQTEKEGTLGVVSKPCDSKPEGFLPCRAPELNIHPFNVL